MNSTRLLSIVCLICLSSTLAVAGGHDWPQWRGPNNDGRSEQSGIFSSDQDYGLKVVWKKKLGSSYSSVTVAGGLAYTMFSDNVNDYLVALDADSGTEKWRYTIDTTYEGHDGSDDGTVSTPLFHGGTVYGIGPKGQLFALDAATGKKQWETNLKSEHKGVEPNWGFTTSPLIVDDVLIVLTGGPENSMITGFNKDTGAVLWTAGESTVTYQSPIPAEVHGTMQLVATGDTVVLGLEAKTGKILWQYDHEGNYQSAHPIAVGDNRFFVRFAGREAVLLSIVEKHGVFSAEEVWKSREIRQTFNISVFDKGYLFGYAGRFLTCVDASNGEQRWKSRAPGDGFLIYVDGHLVVQTKEGVLHVVKATSDAYHEVANLDLFEDVVWSPPSFANGRIFVRSQGEIAAIEIVPSDQPLTVAVDDSAGVAKGSQFASFVEKVEAAQNQEKLVEEFMASQSDFPVIEHDNLVHFVYLGPVQDLAIRGDMLDTGEEVPMRRVGQTDLYYRSFSLEPDGHVCYQYTKDFDNRIPDPRNPKTLTTFNGEESELGMPRWQTPEHLAEPKGKPRGTVDSFELESKIIEGSRTVEVYLPSGYADGEGRYPTIYVNYGQFAVESGKIPNTLDNLIADKEITPVIAVFVHAPNSVQEYVRAQRDQYAQLIADELIPTIDSKYRTVAEPESRAFMGGDEGGFSAIYTAFKHPGTFSMVAGQSTHLYAADGDTLKQVVRESKDLSIRFYLDWGTYDSRGAAQDYDWAVYNRDFHSFIKELGYPVEAHEVHDAFGWCSWRNRTDKILKLFFAM